MIGVLFLSLMKPPLNVVEDFEYALTTRLDVFLNLAVLLIKRLREHVKDFVDDKRNAGIAAS